MAAEGGNALLPGRSKCDPWEPRWKDDVEGQREHILRYTYGSDIQTQTEVLLDLYDHLERANLLSHPEWSQ